MSSSNRAVGLLLSWIRGRSAVECIFPYHIGAHNDLTFKSRVNIGPQSFLIFYLLIWDVFVNDYPRRNDTQT